MTNSLQTIRDAWGTAELGEARITVRSNADLAAAIDTLEASGGGTILLDAAGGPYDVSVRGYRGEGAPLVIASLDPGTPATVRHLDITRSEYVAIADLKIDGGEANRAGEAGIFEGRDIVLVGIEARGRADGFLDGTDASQRGDSFLLVRESRDITIADSVIADMNHGIGVLNTTGLKVIGNDISGIQGDGFRGGGIQDALFEGNHFHDFYGSTQVLNHSDMLQLWSTNVDLLNARIVIRDNVFDAGEMAATQTIFIGHEAYQRPEYGPSMAYEDITIEGNVIFNGARNGIAVSATNNAIIRDNTVLWNKDATTKRTVESDPANDVPWIRVADMPGLVVENNIAPNISTGNGALDAELRAQNTILDFLDASSPNYAYDHIVNLEGGDGDARDLEIRTDSPFFGVAGAPLSSPAGQEGVEALLSQSPIMGAPLGVSLTAELSRVDGAPAGDAATYVWRLEDGRAFEGAALDWVFDAPGRHVVSLEVTMPDGRTDTIERAIDIAAPELVALDFAQGARDLSAYGAEVVIRGEDTQGDGTFLLRPDTGLSMGRRESQLTNLKEFEIEVGFRKSQADGTGPLVGQHGRLEAEILPNGGIRFHLETTEGRFSVQTGPGLVLDTARHELILGFDAEGGTMSITLDGTLVAEGEAGGMLTANGGHTLGLGKAFEPNIEAEVDSFVVRVPETVDADAIREAAVPYAGAAESGPVPEDISFDPDEDGAAPDMMILKETDFDGVMSEGILLKDPNGADAGGTQGRDGMGFALDGRSKVIVSQGSEALEGVHGFEMTAAIAKDAANGEGTIMGIHGTLNLKVLSDGAINLWVSTDAGEFKIRSEAGTLATTDWHDVGIRFDGANGTMAILLDGEEVAAGEAWGAMPPSMSQHLMVGRAFGGGVEGRVDDVVLAIDADCAAAPDCAAPGDDWYAPAAPAEQDLAAYAADQVTIDL